MFVYFYFSCWTTDASIPYAVNMSYFALIFLFNTGILITVSFKIFMLRKADNKTKTVNVCKNVSTVLGLMCLLGTTWGLAFFTSGYTNYPILYLFCILNSMQGGVTLKMMFCTFKLYMCIQWNLDIVSTKSCEILNIAVSVGRVLHLPVDVSDRKAWKTSRRSKIYIDYGHLHYWQS